jgi:hypothetical protein
VTAGTGLRRRLRYRQYYTRTHLQHAMNRTTARLAAIGAVSAARVVVLLWMQLASGRLVHGSPRSIPPASKTGIWDAPFAENSGLVRLISQSLRSIMTRAWILRMPFPMIVIASNPVRTIRSRMTILRGMIGDDVKALGKILGLDEVA